MPLSAPIPRSSSARHRGPPCNGKPIRVNLTCFAQSTASSIISARFSAASTPITGVTWTEGGIVHTLFQLHYESVNDRIAVTYGGRNYYVREGDPADHTLQVLSLLSQLINANKNANEIPTTKAVQIVP